MISIREATLSDLDAIMSVEQACFKVDGFNKRQFRRLIVTSTSRVFVITHRDKVIGHGVVLVTPLRNGQTKGRVYSLAVLPEHEHQGYGRQLRAHMWAYLASISVAYITAECHAENKRLVKSNTLAGYRITGGLKGYYTDGSDAFRWRKDL
jgi:ribosomal protein S18 acetylase RimI-like enzyme